MPFDPALIRHERFQAELGYHAAYTFWNLRGLLAERWAHGPVFGGYRESKEAVILTPASTAPDDDLRIHGIYGFRASGLNAEGPRWVPEGIDLYDQWIGECLEVLKPKRVVRSMVSLFYLYPADNPLQASRRLRGYYRNDKLDAMFPQSLRDFRDRHHSAIDFIVPLDDHGSTVSVILGTVGPIHQGADFFSTPNEERDTAWWTGLRYQRNTMQPDGFDDPQRHLREQVETSLADAEHILTTVLREVDQ